MFNMELFRGGEITQIGMIVFLIGFVLICITAERITYFIKKRKKK